uniref:C-type lectin domain-containing protein n=1 Tax=Myripristis murdjan TaxID=586833 RepID=A0A667ZLG2_9TELE
MTHWLSLEEVFLIVITRLLPLSKKKCLFSLEMMSHICPDGWTYFSGSCYFMSSERKNWFESRQDCLRRGADLVIINSREENSFLKNSGLTAWVGLSDLETEGEWKWVDGSSLSYKYWAKGQPDDYGGEDCGEVRPTRDGWNDLPCSERLQWICEKRIPKIK